MAQLKFPLVFFGLALTVVESSFGAALVRHTYSDAVTITFGCIMGALFLCSITAVAMLTYKVPSHIMLQPQETARDLQAEMRAQSERVRHAARAFCEYSELRQKTPRALLETLGKVESILSGTSNFTAAIGATVISSPKPSPAKAQLPSETDSLGDSEIVAGESVEVKE